MSRCTGFRARSAAALLLVAGALGAGTLAAAESCDRECLDGFVDRYLDALVAHQPTMLPLAAGVRFTEDGQELLLGDGLWRTMRAKGAYRLFVTDVAAGQVAFFGSIQEENRDPAKGTAALIALRLRVKQRQITEIEQLVIRSEMAAQHVDTLTPDPIYLKSVPATQRASRADLIRIANKYFTGMQQNDGKGVYPFTDDCNRIENGSLTTNVPPRDGQPVPDPKTATSYSASWSCKQQFESGLLHFVTRIRDRRYVAVDPERGMVFAFAFFDHSAGDTRTFQTPTGRTVTAGPNQPWTWEIAELFKIEKGKLHQIEAILDRSPYGMLSGWSNWEDGMSSRARN